MASRAFIPWLRTILLLLVGLALAGLGFGLYLSDANQIAKNATERESNRMRVFVRLVRSDYESVFSDLRVLADGDGLLDYLGSHHQADLDRAIHRAIFMSQLQPDYDQIRFLDESGMEVFRVNALGAVVPTAQLQNKADRDYFQKAITLAPGQIYISRFDLNVEHGQVEQPPKPMVRFSEPVFDATGKVRGVYVINDSGGNILERLRQFTPQYDYRLRILNSQGYWLKSDDPAQNWGFMFPGGTGLTLARTDPQLWAQIQSAPNGQIPYKGGVFTWHRFVPAEMVFPNSTKVVAGDDYLVLASELSADDWNGLFFDLRRTLLIAAGAIGLLVLLGAWLQYLHLRAREALRQNDERFHLMLESIRDYAIIMLNPEGRIVSWNTGAERIHGYRAEEIIGRHFSRFYPEEAVREGLPEAMLRIAAVQGRSADEGWRIRKDGTRFWASVVIAAIRTPDGRLVGFVKITRDQTERRKVEDQNQKLNQVLQERAAELEAVNQELEAFSYSVSHDLRAPLRHVDGFVDLLARHSAAKLDEKEQRYLRIVSDSARQMGALIDDLLVFSRMGRSEMRFAPVSMDALVREAIESFAPETKDRRIEWKIAPLPPALGDLSMLRQVWLNLIGNAIKYTRTRPEAVIEIGSRMEGDEQVYFVRDNGVGFDMRYVDKLFGVFHRLHRADEFEGTGIGLANVRRIVTRHRGRTWAEGEADRGATFYFALLKTQPGKKT
jgi:PAS domain S-box-containing protein